MHKKQIDCNDSKIDLSYLFDECGPFEDLIAVDCFVVVVEYYFVLARGQNTNFVLVQGLPSGYGCH